MRSDANTKRGHASAIVDAILDWMLASVLSYRGSMPPRIGLSGLQGSGKSTLARELAMRARQRGVAIEVVALDDFYLRRRDRLRLARDVHPLLATRGVPGTHDMELLGRTLDALGRASATQPVSVPRFDKGKDTRLPPSRDRVVETRADIVLIEGWCVGIPAQSDAALARPINRLERERDRDARWRRWVNAELAARYVPLWRRLDRLIVLEAPRFSVVSRWRAEAEQALRDRNAPHAMSADALRDFTAHFERLSRHALDVLPACAHLRVVLDANRRVRALIAQRD